ncbi:MAG: hypothetical protein ACKOC5_15975, partial [Chloroflexota bacterium]
TESDPMNAPVPPTQNPPGSNGPQPYVIAPLEPAPADYPFEPVPDEYSSTPFAATFEERRRAYFEFVRRSPAPTTVKAAWHELARLGGGGEPHVGVLQAALAYVDARLDCADYSLHALLRLVYQYRDHGRVPPELVEQVEQALLRFKYWPDEPGQDGMVTWTEGHYILFASAAYLAGQLYPEQTFSNTGESGALKMERFRERLLRWMDLRFRSGFSEWLADVNIDEACVALLSLSDFARDPQINRRACMLVDLLAYEMAVHNFNGVFAGAHARSFENSKKWAAQEATTDTQKLLFGRGVFNAADNMSAAAFALSRSYRLPQVIYDIAADQQRPELLHRQRVAFNLDEAAAWGLNGDDFEDGMLLLNQEGYLHPRFAGLFVEMLDAFEWWDHPQLERFREKRSTLKTLRAGGMLGLYAQRYAKDLGRTAREQANLYTYRTPDYQLASVQDYHKGSGGFHEHLWQATLGPDAVCFTTQPARAHGHPPN